MDAIISIDILQEMKYADMQKLAKSVGIRANMKADKLLVALKKYAVSRDSHQPDQVGSSGPESGTEQSAESASEQESHDEAPRGKAPRGRKGRQTRTRQPAEVKSVMVDSPVKPPARAVSIPTVGKPLPPTTGSARKSTPASVRLATPTTGSARRSTPALATPTGKKPLTPTTGSAGKARLLLSASRRCTPTPRQPGETLSAKRSTPASLRLATPVYHTPVNEQVALAGRKRRLSNTPCSTSRPGSAAKRHRLESPSDPNNVSTPSSAAKRRSRSNSYTLDESEVSCPKPHVASPSTQDLLDSVHHSHAMSDGEMKDRLLEVIDKKVLDKLETTGVTKGSQIPRFAAFAAKKKAEAANRTPGQLRWTKIHARNFDKMDSIDQYLAKKRKRTEQITASVKKAQDLAEQARSTLEHLKESTKKSANPTASPAKSRTALFKSPAHSGEEFVPKVTSVSMASFNFGTASKTPKERPTSSTDAACTKENVADSQQSKSSPAPPRKSTGATLSRKSLVTPYKFNATTSEHTALSCQKPKFDLAESLAQKTTWKPHKGKLKPFVFGGSHVRDVKAAKVTTKAERRQEEQKRRNQRRAGVHMDRRGLKA